MHFRVATIVAGPRVMPLITEVAKFSWLTFARMDHLHTRELASTPNTDRRVLGPPVEVRNWLASSYVTARYMLSSARDPFR